MQSHTPQCRAPGFSVVLRPGEPVSIQGRGHCTLGSADSHNTEGDPLPSAAPSSGMRALCGGVAGRLAIVIQVSQVAESS